MQVNLSRAWFQVANQQRMAQLLSTCPGARITNVCKYQSCMVSKLPMIWKQSLKITFEAPPGIKKNLQRTYEGWGAEMVEKGTVQRAQLLFVLAWFHAVVQVNISHACF